MGGVGGITTDGGACASGFRGLGWRTAAAPGRRTRQPMLSRAPVRATMERTWRKRHRGPVFVRRDIRADIADPMPAANSSSLRLRADARAWSASPMWTMAGLELFGPDLVWPALAPARFAGRMPPASAARRVSTPACAAAVGARNLPPLWTERALAAKSTRHISESSFFT